MNRIWFNRLVQVGAFTIAIAAVLQEFEKPREERLWYGTIAGFIPYDFRLPTLERFKESYWNPCDSRIFTREVFGIGWAINFYSLLERLSLLRQQAVLSEEDFLMPTPAMKELLAQPEVTD